MNTHEMTIYKMKSAIFELFSSPSSRPPLQKNLAALKKSFMNCFEIEFAEILLYENNRFVPIHEPGKAYIHSGIAEEQMTAINPLFRASFLSQNEEGRTYADDSLIIRDKKLVPLGAILFEASEKWNDFALSPSLKELKTVLGSYFGQEIQMELITEQEKTYRRLFEMAELFNSTMETNIILDAMLKAVTGSFEGYDIQLLLSQDQRGLSKDYRLFNYSNERTSAVEAFLSGELTLEKNIENGVNLLNAPIRGRQGIYGVVQIIASVATDFTRTQKDFIRMITNAAGIALENASLYDQSHRLVNDLQLVNEAARKLNNNLTLDEVISYLKIQFMKAFDPDEMAFVFYKENNTYTISTHSTDYFHEDIGEQMVMPIVKHFMRSQETIFDGAESVGSDYFKSRIALPITNREDMLGFVILLHKEEYYFSFDNFKLMRSLISHSSLAISNILLRDQLQELVDKDNLTKLFTRKYLDEIVVSDIEQGRTGVFILLDVDDFKMVNDAYGHKAGDEVLQQISNHITDRIDGIGIASRWGGEEIAIYLPSVSCKEGVKLARSLVESIPSKTEPRVTVSMGLTCSDEIMIKSYNEIFQKTDKAMYSAKKEGKNRLVINKATSTQ